MTILEALRQVTSSIKTWADNKFLNKDTTADDFGIYVQDTEPLNAIDGDIWIDTASDPSIIPNTDIPNALPNPYALTFSGAVSGSYNGSDTLNVEIEYPVTSVNGKTGIVTIDTLPTVTTADNGKVLMVVNGAWQAVDLNMSVDANGVVSI